MRFPGLKEPDDSMRRDLNRATRRGFLGAGAFIATGYLSWRALLNSPRDGWIRKPTRRVLEWEERVARAAYRADRLAPSFPLAQAEMPIVNGSIGMMHSVDFSAWTLRVEGPERQPRTFTLKEIQAMPRVASVMDLKCVEGWSTIVRWAGVRFLDSRRDRDSPRGAAARPIRSIDRSTYSHTRAWKRPTGSTSSDWTRCPRFIRNPSSATK